MTATATETDILAALDYDEERECEHPHHADDIGRSHDVGAASHWAITQHPCFGPPGTPYPVCLTYMIVGGRPGDGHCYWCGEHVGLSPVKILGPIGAM